MVDPQVPTDRERIPSSRIEIGRGREHLARIIPGGLDRSTLVENTGGSEPESSP
jgi:hypothetical protein